MTMHNPPHPGEALREDVLPEMKLSVTALAKHLGYSRGNCPRSLMVEPRSLLTWLGAWSWPAWARPICGLLGNRPTIYGRRSIKTCLQSLDCTRPSKRLLRAD